MSNRYTSTSKISSGKSLAVFSPLSVANCELWLDAGNAASVTLVSNVVSQWNDLSGNNRHATQGTGNNRPTYSATVNGRNVISFDGVNDSLISGLASSVITGYATLFCVARPSASWTTSTANFKSPLLARNADATLGWGMALYNDAASNRLTLNYLWRGAGGNYSYGPRVDTGSLQVFTAVLAASPQDRRVSGSSGNYTTSLTAGTGGASNRYLTVGEDPTQSRYWTDYVAEVLVYSRTLTTAEILSIESYLISKWGITRQ
jgi:hypothetical protein